uniref:DNA-directed RNA polymerase n=1 Tax=viral metagenome TaxID=1070528 RepID=A0A6C0HIB8_9ZZZZ
MPRQPKVNKVTTKNKVHEVPLINEMIQKACEATTSMPAKFTETHDVLLDDLGDYLEEPFTIIQSYFEGKQLERLSRHQIESYNNFVNYQMQKTIEMFNPIVIKSENDFIPQTGEYGLVIHLTITNLKFYPPQIYENNGATKLMMPQEARLRNFTYSSSTTVDLFIKYHVRDTDNHVRIIEKEIPQIRLCNLPVMLKSSICSLTQYKNSANNVTGECAMDCGGYFVVKGSEKTVICQERAAENRIYVFNGKNTPKWNWIAEFKSVPDTKCISPKHMEMMISAKTNIYGNGIYVSLPRMKQKRYVELFVLFRALGVKSDKEICEYIILNTESKKHSQILNYLQASMEDAKTYMTDNETIQTKAFDHMVTMVAYNPYLLPQANEKATLTKKEEVLRDIFQNDLFPHCKSKMQKLYLLGYMASRLISTALGWYSPDDRDSYLNKRIELTGTLLNNLFRNHYIRFVKDVEKQVVKEINLGPWKSSEDYDQIINMTNVYKIFKPTTIENGLNRALSTGDFSVKQSSNSNKVGVAQVLNRLNYFSILSHLRRVNTPLEKNGELTAPRKLHNTTWGYLCPVETPEGQSIGIVKNLSFMTHLTIPTHSYSLYELLVPDIIAVEDFKSPTEAFEKVKVFVNGSWVGIAKEPQALYESLKEKKYRNIINLYTSIIFDYGRMEIRICNDAGRMTRPVLRVKNNRVLMTKDIIARLNSKEITWTDLLTNNILDEAVIEYIDPEEQNHAMIAMKQKDKYLHHLRADFDETKPLTIRYNYCEIHPCTLFGILASCVPFPDYNQAPRNTYQCAMAKQAMGVSSLNYDKRMDKTSYILNYPSRPLVDTRMADFIHLNKIPSGCQIHVAIMSYTGYNQEDSVLINKSAIDRGLLLATIYHTEKDEDKNVIRDEIIRCRPDPSKTRSIKHGNYSKINLQGFIPENTFVENRDIIISKVVPIKENRNDPTKVIKYEDQSKSFRTSEETYIDKNFTGRNGEGCNFAKTRVRVMRKPVMGDKVSSRHGQKGTIGNILPESDMPFSKDGLRPDLILNPHAIPSRMTIAHLKETLLGKVLLELGLFGDATSFGNLDVHTICEELQKLGYESYGNEILYDGHTGRQIETCIFVGPVYYQRLKHMVNDKEHSRSIGPMVNLTRQPAEGRSRDGGFRIGEMERDVMIAHGMSKFCRERLYNVSDKYAVHVCKKCGMVATFNNGDKSILRAKAGMTVHKCNTCGNMTDFVYVEVPYAFKLMSQELQCINIVPRIITE